MRFNKERMLAILAAFINIEGMGAEVKKESEALFPRADVPKGNYVPLDLRDKSANFINTSNGYRQSGRILAQDIKLGGTSSGATILLALMVFGIYGVSLIGQSFMGKGIDETMIGLGGAFVLGSLVFVWLTGNIRASLMVLGLGLLFSFSGAVSALMTRFGVSTTAVSHILFAVPALLPFLFTRWAARSRAKRLLRQSINFTGEDSYEKVTGATEIRHAQAKQAFTDEKSGYRFMRLGSYLGVSRKALSPFAPDAGQICGYNAKDSESLTAIFGAHGSGKTALLRNIMNSYLADRSRGAFIQDGKGVLPYESKKILDIVLDHTAVYNPIEGLLSEEVSRRIASKHSFQGDKNVFFTNNQELCVRHCTEILHQVTHHRVNTALHYNIFGIVQVLKSVENEAKRKILLASLKALSNTTEDRRLSETIMWLEGLANLSPDVSGSIFSGAGMWLEEFFADRELAAWAHCVKSDIKLEEIFTSSKRIGIGIGSNYGQTGIANLLLLTAQFYKKLKASQKLDINKNRFIWLIDEAPAVLRFSEDGFGHNTMFADSRSMGADMYCAMQAVSQLGSITSNQKVADSFLSLFGSSIYFKTTDQATFNHAQFQMGEAPINTMIGNDAKSINYLATAKNAARSAAFDSEHPDRDLIKSSGFMLNTGFRSLKESSDDYLILNAPLTAQAIKPILTKADWYKYLNMPNVALAILRRGGAVRHDFFYPIGLDSNFQPFENAKNFEAKLSELAAEEAQVDE